MRDYLAVGATYTPFLMEATLPNHYSPAFSTDQYGLRTTLKDGQPLTLDRFRSPTFQGRRGVLVGNSTAFGVGATSDGTTIPSQLNRSSRLTWFNISGRRYQSTQELLAYMLYAPTDVAQVVIFSGINNFDYAPRWFQPQQQLRPPFIRQELYQRALQSHYTPQPPPAESRLKQLLRRLLRRPRYSPESTPQRRNFFSAEVQSHFFPADHSNASYFKHSGFLERSLATLDRDLDRWAHQFKGTGREVIYILQPIPEWTNKQFSPEEKQIFAAMDKIRGVAWQEVSQEMKGMEDIYRSRMAELCRTRGIRFFDANSFDWVQKTDWIFIDRYHLTDYGQKTLAAFILDQVG
ncbi:MAG: hypothetical protein HQL72_08530 [Magnetococcales bacterium]|nr:hypothetical protein [Magnetococcales bacterium]